MLLEGVIHDSMILVLSAVKYLRPGLPTGAASGVCAAHSSGPNAVDRLQGRLETLHTQQELHVPGTHVSLYGREEVPRMLIVWLHAPCRVSLVAAGAG